MRILLIIVALFMGCSTSSTVSINLDDILIECKNECRELEVSSTQWCDCVHNCSSDKIPIDGRAYVEECH